MSATGLTRDPPSTTSMRCVCLTRCVCLSVLICNNGLCVHQVNLVSEHIWCNDFLVRSFYLKNVQTQETRTLTQFHFLSWPAQGIPTSTRTLLDFRRYRMDIERRVVFTRHEMGGKKWTETGSDYCSF